MADRHRPAVLLYAGDHDATGDDILGDLVRRTDCWKHVEHVALKADQIDRYRLPPAPGKATDPRAATFIAKHGELVQVELDALDPDTLQQLYADALAGWWDDDAYRSAQYREDAQRDALRSAARRLRTAG